MNIRELRILKENTILWNSNFRNRKEEIVLEIVLTRIIIGHARITLKYISDKTDPDKCDYPNCFIHLVVTVSKIQRNKTKM